MHNSQGNTSLEGPAGGALVLLRGEVSNRAEIHKLCLQCHASNGTQATVAQQPHGKVAPKVYSPGIWTEADPFNLIGAGGNFSTELDLGWGVTTPTALGYGHSIGATNVTPPGGDTLIAEFSCTNCHDPHGTNIANDSKINIFRNLKVDVTGAGANSGVELFVGENFTKMDGGHRSYVGGISGQYYTEYFGGDELDQSGNVIWPVYRGTLTATVTTDASNSNAYGRGEGSDTLGPPYPIKNISNWCAQCHDNWHEKVTPANRQQDWGKFGSDNFRTWRRHAVSSQIPMISVPNCAGACHKSALDRTNYSNLLVQAGRGLPVTTGGGFSPPISNVYYLPQPAFYPSPPFSMGMPQNAPMVFCLTCHFAHGGPYYDNLRWDYLAGVDSGEQTAKSIESVKGCQLCHNR